MPTSIQIALLTSRRGDRLRWEDTKQLKSIVGAAIGHPSCFAFVLRTCNARPYAKDKTRFCVLYGSCNKNVGVDAHIDPNSPPYLKEGGPLAVGGYKKVKIHRRGAHWASTCFCACSADLLKNPPVIFFENASPL